MWDRWFKTWYNKECVDADSVKRYDDNRHYLSKFANIDYFRKKTINVISQFTSFHTKFSIPEGTYTASIKKELGYFNTTKTENANFFWFNCYNSIIHGAVGIIPYIVFGSFYDNPCTEKL